MITLYHCVSARSFRPLWMLEELDAKYTLKMLPFPPRANARAYLDINPLGTVPALTDGPATMTESAAICQYLAMLYGGGQFNVAPTDAHYAAYLNYLHFGEATLTFPQTLILRYGRFEPAERQLPQVVEDYTKWFLGRLKTLDARLDASLYLCGDRFTAADVSVGYALMLADYLGLSAQFTPSVLAYWERLRQRPAFQRALEVQESAAKVQNVPITPAPLTIQTPPIGSK